MTQGWFTGMVPITVPIAAASFGDAAWAAQASFDSGLHFAAPNARTHGHSGPGLGCRSGGIVASRTSLVIVFPATERLVPRVTIQLRSPPLSSFACVLCLAMSSKRQAGSDSVVARVRDVSHLGDFTISPRMLVITCLAVPIGVVAACVPWVLLRLIGLITNAVFYGRVDTGLVAPDAGHHKPVVVLFAPVAGGLVIGLTGRLVGY